MPISPKEPQKGEIWRSKDNHQKLWYIEYCGRALVVSTQIKIVDGEPQRVSEEEVSEDIHDFFDKKEDTFLSFNPHEFYAWSN